MQRIESAAVRLPEELRQRRAQQKKTARPLGITLIAGIQFLKAAVLLLTFTLLELKPETVNGPDSPLSPLLYVATRGRYDSMNAALQGGNALTELLLLLSLYLGAIGVGMLYVNAWARRTLIFSCGLSLVLFAKSSLWPDPAAAASPDMTHMYALFAVDTCILLYLMRDNTVEVFERRR